MTLSNRCFAATEILEADASKGSNDMIQRAVRSEQKKNGFLDRWSIGQWNTNELFQKLQVINLQGFKNVSFKI